MNIIKIFLIFGLLVNANTGWAYGTSSSKKACEKPRFADFNPPDKAKVDPRSEFSFIASSLTNPQTIKVTVKGLPVTVNVDPVNQGFQVKGALPPALQGTFARISISAEGMNRCKGSGGWLVNISE